MHNKLEELEEKLEYKFNNINLLVTALTHKSYAYENAKEAKTEYNERLEFLGDAILEHTISDLLFKDKNKFKEGEMSKMRARGKYKYMYKENILEDGKQYIASLLKEYFPKNEIKYIV